MSNNSFKVKNAITLSPTDLATLSNPQAGDLACDINDSNKIKRYDAATSAWAEVGSGGVGSLDILFAQDFESASLSSFTQTGLALDTVDPLHGKVSAKLTHQAAINQSFKQVVAVDRKFRGQAIVMRLNVKSSASAGNVTISVYDETNAASLLSSTQLQLSNDVDGVSNAVSFTIPSTSSSISYTITALPEAGSPVTFIDDIVAELSNVALLETSVTVPNVTSWASYTPTFQGFGSPTNIEFEWRQVGENVEIRGKFTAGTPTAVEARVGLPGGLTSAGTGIIPSLSIAGTAATAAGGSARYSVILIEPSVNYLTFGESTATSNSLSKKIASSLISSGEAFSFSASVPCSGLSATSDKTIALTQSGLVQEADSSLVLTGGTVTGSSTFSFSGVFSSNGDAFVWNGTNRITVSKDGIYNISATAFQNGATSVTPSIRINGGTNYSGSTATTNTAGATVANSLQLKANDYIEIFNISGGNANNGIVSCSYQGSLKQVAVNPNSRITIPTSELRFTGSSSRGTADSGTRVKFDTLASIRGDAFTVTNDATGTSITMKKAGILSVSSSLVAASTGYGQIVVGNKIASAFNAGLSGGSGSWDGSVAIWDIIYVVAGVNPNGNVAISLYLSFQEQDISVSVTNTLPQFSDSDSYVRVATGNGFGSSATTIRRFASVTSNVGTDILYVDSPTAGASFTVQSAGVYSISYSDISVSSTPTILILVNGTIIANGTISTISGGATPSAQPYLQAGDVITVGCGQPASISSASGSAQVLISKVGKPNVTGVDVTPFVNVPQPESQSSYLTQTATFGATTITGALTTNTNNGIFSYNSSTGTYTVLKRANFTINAGLRAAGAASAVATINVDGTIVALANSPAVTGQWASATYSQVLNAGQTFTISNGVANNSDQQRISVTATALSDQILTAPETFSTDTASLRYANASEYTLSTLQNAPVGTYITFTYAANTNTRTQTTLTNRPTQTDADMNANGIQLFTRAFNAPSTAAQPAAIAIQIGKGLKGKSLDLYKSAGKVTAGSLDAFSTNTGYQQGLMFKEYNELTGILILDSGFAISTANTSNTFFYSDGSAQTSGYLVINASKNPALTGIGLNRVAARAVNSSGQAINNISAMTYDSIKHFDTHNALNTSTGVFTAPESGYYQINARATCASQIYTATNQNFYIILRKNGSNYSSGSLAVSWNTTTSVILTSQLSDVIYFTKGEYFDLIAYNDKGSGNLFASGVFNFVSISKVSV